MVTEDECIAGCEAVERPNDQRVSLPWCDPGHIKRRCRHLVADLPPRTLAVEPIDHIAECQTREVTFAMRQM